MKEISENVFQAWVILGDLNFHLTNSDASPSVTTMDNWICNVVNNAGLMDLGFSGSQHTWTSRINGLGPRRARIDMALHNDIWIRDFPDSKVKHLPFPGSDHFPLLLVTEVDVVRPRNAWKFYRCWLQNSNASAVIEDAWNCATKDDTVSQKLNITRRKLSKWNREQFDRINFHIKNLRDQLSDIQALPYSEDNSYKINLTLQRLQHWKKIEAYFWHQKYGDTWFKDLDNNTIYFHNMANRRKA
ncbi:uncharacterized protein LOC113278979 [Papaver somniferum]|uniref:uncharacterized protein LOC113278979 n=1 Tax=Papaver somniferum TaxID=3469 RepID=UPI000E6FFAA7|nr:uncharacterized protein LOC113278979 [Papaver somniferum]